MTFGKLSPNVTSVFTFVRYLMNLQILHYVTALFLIQDYLVPNGMRKYS